MMPCKLDSEGNLWCFKGTLLHLCIRMPWTLLSLAEKGEPEFLKSHRAFCSASNQLKQLEHWVFEQGTYPLQEVWSLPAPTQAGDVHYFLTREHRNILAIEHRFEWSFFPIFKNLLFSSPLKHHSQNDFETSKEDWSLGHHWLQLPNLLVKGLKIVVSCSFN